MKIKIETHQFIFWSGFLFCLALTIYPLWSVHYLPMHDIPQHATQVFLLNNFDNPAFDIKNRYQIDYFTPYLTGILLARFFALFFDVVTSIKIVLSLTALAFPLSLYFLAKKAKIDSHWAFVGFPFFYNMAFYIGHLNFLVALPLGFTILGYGYNYTIKPSLKEGLVLAFLFMGLFFSHAVVYVIITGMTAYIIVIEIKNKKEIPLTLIPLILPSLVFIFWLVSFLEGRPLVEKEYAFVPLDRIKNLSWNLFGKPGFLIFPYISLLLCLEIDLKKNMWMTGMFLGLFFAYCFGPGTVGGVHVISDRISVFLIPSLFLILSAKKGKENFRGTFLFLILMTIISMGILSNEFSLFQKEAGGFDHILKAIKPKKTLLGLMVDKKSRVVRRFPMFWHFPAWYSALKGGDVGLSFSSNFQDNKHQIVNYKKGFELIPPQKMVFHSRPKTINWEEYNHFDYYLVRDKNSSPDWFVEKARGEVHLATHKGTWWLFERNFKD